MTRRPPAAGFTLLEVLVALALTAIVTLLMLDGMRNATLGLDRLASHADAFDRRHGADALLRRELGAAIAIALAPGSAAGFAGTPQSLHFITSAGGSGAGLYRIDLAYRDRALLLTRRAADPEALPHRDRSVLARRLRSFNLAYYGALPQGADPAWHDRWGGVRYLPRLVRITIGEREPRPPLVVRLWGADG
jgi:general secretion pathway protein J